ncbi:MBL fold metallo-hydrolase [Phenylobacterium sp.]|uniref:MBL fold metallo-hydrolase n=1 Tax=Phenylobacterium sp. TaxID=1871053 RepID=UPI0035AEE6B1
MPRWEYSKGLHEVGRGVYAYLSPDGSWGWSNAGLIVDGDRSLLVDTLFDLKLTSEMLQAMRDATGVGARQIRTVVNTHANGDHTYGNVLVKHAEIIASLASAEEMDEFPPGMMAELVKQPGLGDGAAFIAELFGGFQFEGVEHVPPTRTYSGRLDLRVGDKDVRLLEVGPAHTRGDTLVHVPSEKTIYTGDILFIGGTPVMWTGPVANWIAACDLILGLDVDVIVPGHGPVTDKAGVRGVRDYLVHVRDEAWKRFQDGMPFDAAARDIALREFGAWSDSERLVVNVHSLYREFGASNLGESVLDLFAHMKRYRDACAGGHCGHADHAR